MAWDAAPIDEAAQRACVVAEARSWIGTRWHHYAAVKGAGVDCARLLVEAYSAAGLIEHFIPPEYPCDWHCHRSEELLVQTIERFAREFDWRAQAPQPADVVVWRYGRTFSHSAIVSHWPTVVHAFALNGYVEETDVEGSPMTGREMRAFTLWPRVG